MTEQRPPRQEFVLYDGDLAPQSPRSLRSQHETRNERVTPSPYGNSRYSIDSMGVRTDFTSSHRRKPYQHSSMTETPNNAQSSQMYKDACNPHENTPYNRQTSPQLMENAILNQAPPFITSRNGLIFLIAAIFAGISVGILFYVFNVPQSVSKWIALPGTLYTRAIQCIGIPLIFVDLIVSVSDMVLLQKAQSIAWRFVLLTLAFAIVGVLEGIGSAHLFRYITQINSIQRSENRKALFSIQCSNGRYLEAFKNGSVACSALSVQKRSTFGVLDINDVLQRNSDLHIASGTFTINLVELLNQFVPYNIVVALIGNTLLSIVAFAIPCGITVARSFHGPVQRNPLLEFLRELNGTLITMINLIMRMTPIAVFCLLTESFGNDALRIVVGQPAIIIAVYLLSVFTAIVFVHMFVVLPIVYAAFAHHMPFAFIRYLLPAYVYSFGCASSAASLPVSTQCIDSSRQVAEPIVNLVMACSTALHKNGTAIYLPLMIYFMVDMSGLTSELHIQRVCMLFLASVLGAIGAAPIPGGSLVMLLTVWKISFPEYDVPDIYVFITTLDVILDRICTVANIHGDAILCRIISEQVEELLTDEILRGRDNMHISSS